MVLVYLLQSACIGGVDGGDNGNVVLVFEEVEPGGSVCVIERIGKRRIVWPEGEFVDVVGEVEGCSCGRGSVSGLQGTYTTPPTAMIQMLSVLHIPMASGGNVEITLHLVRVHCAVDPATVDRVSPPRLRRLLKLLAVRSGPEIVVHIFFQIFSAISAGLSSRRSAPGSRGPLEPGGRVGGQCLSGHDAITRGVLQVDVDVLAFHLDDQVEIDLQVSPNPLFHGEGVGGVADPPAAELADDEPDAGTHQHHRPDAAGRRLLRVARLGLGKGIEGLDDAARRLCIAAKVGLVETLVRETVHGKERR